MIKYGVNSVCPVCKNELALRPLKKGFRLKCKKCDFKIYPLPLEQMEQELLTAFVDSHVGHHIDSEQSRLNKYTFSLQASAIQEQEE